MQVDLWEKVARYMGLGKNIFTFIFDTLLRPTRILWSYWYFGRNFGVCHTRKGVVLLTIMKYGWWVVKLLRANVCKNQPFQPHPGSWSLGFFSYSHSLKYLWNEIKPQNFLTQLGSDFIAISNNGQNRKSGKFFDFSIFCEIEVEKKVKEKLICPMFLFKLTQSKIVFVKKILIWYFYPKRHFSDGFWWNFHAQFWKKIGFIFFKYHY